MNNIMEDIEEIKDFFVCAGIFILALIGYMLFAVIKLFLIIAKLIYLPLNKLVNKINKIMGGKQQYD